ncbi:EFR1 family ferrodoxin [Tannerella sp.]|uniref:EFR1 family ferrodoxin n=1 Tax=Tannerella sp. TaxID=2382127 RepID=UPI0026DCA04D|nr:EFR1 family ferrodoxin [Tannerella sp.]MDO4702590.1 EFR1 family ferrodoxin [Tannerella sp.]
MVFYFSGTGNSLWVARSVADAFSEQLIPMSEYLLKDTVKQSFFSLSEGERVGFVFPVHSWGVPPLVKDFIRWVRFDVHAAPFIYAIFTCGDECGYTGRMFQRLLAERGWKSRHIYSLQMPNSYIVFPGFDVDDKALEEKKKKRAKEKLPGLIRAIADDEPADCYLTGSMPFLKSKVIYPLFCRYALNSRPFHVSDDCIACSLCVSQCPTANITLVDKKPRWGRNCTQCLACIHHCPVRAIEYGKTTQKKGRYTYC